MHDMHLKNLKSESSKYSLLKKDELPPRVKFSKDRDDGKPKLHKARWLRLPFVEPKEYYSQVIIHYTYLKLKIHFLLLT